MPLFLGRRRLGRIMGRFWPRFWILILVLAVVVLAGIGVGAYALARGFGPTAGTWTELQGAGTLPLEISSQVQNDHYAAYDPRIGKQIRCFGGAGFSTPYSVWACDPATSGWTQLPTSSVAPTSYELALVNDETSGTVIRLGAVYNPTGTDTWAYDSRSNIWTDLHPSTSPPMYGTVAMAYDPPSRTVIMVGHRGLESHTWAYDSRVNAWTELKTNGAPAARIAAAMAYDKASGRLILFGGLGHLERTYGALLSETWAFDSGTHTWVELKPASSPPSRGFATMAYDEASGKPILFGGGGEGKMFGDTWAYDSAGNTWTKLRTGGSPGALDYASMFYDPVSRRMIVTGERMKGLSLTGLFEAWALSL